MMPRMWVAATTQWYKCHGCRRYKSCIGKVYCGNSHFKTESKKGADECYPTPGNSQFLFCYCSVSKNKICNVWVFVVLNVVCLFVFSIIQIISAFVFVFGSKNPIELTSVMVKWWFCWWLNVLTMRTMGNVTSIHIREEIGQKASTAQSYKDVGALKTPRFRVFHILQQDS